MSAIPLGYGVTVVSTVPLLVLLKVLLPFLTDSVLVASLTLVGFFFGLGFGPSTVGLTLFPPFDEMSKSLTSLPSLTFVSTVSPFAFLLNFFSEISLVLPLLFV